MQVVTCGTKYSEVGPIALTLPNILCGMLTTMANQALMTGRQANLQDGKNQLSSSLQAV